MYNLLIIAGHGGTDPGAVNGAYKEAAFNLRMAGELEDAIKAQTDQIKVYRNRITDKFVSIYDNAKIAVYNNIEKSFSIHCNSSNNASGHGAECFYYGDSAKGKTLATSICNAVATAGLTSYNRGAKANYDFIEIINTGANCESLLFETAFISNAYDLANLKDPGWSKKVMGVIAKEIIKSYGLTPKETTTPTPKFDVLNEVLYMHSQLIKKIVNGNNQEVKDYLKIKSDAIIKAME